MLTSVRRASGVRCTGDWGLALIPSVFGAFFASMFWADGGHKIGTGQYAARVGIVAVGILAQAAPVGLMVWMLRSRNRLIDDYESNANCLLGRILRPLLDASARTGYRRACVDRFPEASKAEADQFVQYMMPSRKARIVRKSAEVRARRRERQPQ